MTVDPILIIAEMRAGELVAALQRAVNGEAHWRLEASKLLTEIADCVLPEPATEALREIDARKRAAEVLEDVISGYAPSGYEPEDRIDG
jgi:hypothetical protein